MIPDLKTIAEQHSYSTHNTEDATTLFLDYAATNTSAILQYKYRDMILQIDSDESYLSKPRASIRTVGHYYRILLPANTEKSPYLLPSETGPIHTE